MSNNYAATIVQVDRLVELDNCDNVQAFPVLGYNAIVSKDTQVGDTLVVFTAETQLSEEFLRANNLYRDSTLNEDPTQKGYFEKNGRVRAMKFRGHRSDALAMPLSSLVFAYPDWVMTLDSAGPDYPAVGDTFEELNGVPICRKYVVPRKPGSGEPRVQTPKERRVDEKAFPIHIDTDNYWRNSFKIAPETHVTVTQKLHGTSVRFGRTLAKRTLTWKERLAKRFGVDIPEYAYELVAGSRKVTKDVNNPDQNHYYASDIWSDAASKYGQNLPENVVVYGELIGWTPDGSPIQQGYTYDLPKGESALYVYRVTVVTNDGHQFDLSWEGVKEFCVQQGFNHVPELMSGPHEFFAEDVDFWLDTRYFPTLSTTAVRLSDPNTVDEGVVVRAEGIVPVVLKAKSGKFLAFETKNLDNEVVDIESEESA